MKFEIKKAKNGLVCVATDLFSETEEKEQIVYQEKYEEDEDIECFADFLRYLNEQYGPSTSRYSKKRIYITIEPGDKYE